MKREYFNRCSQKAKFLLIRIFVFVIFELVCAFFLGVYAFSGQTNKMIDSVLHIYKFTNKYPFDWRYMFSLASYEYSLGFVFFKSINWFFYYLLIKFVIFIIRKSANAITGMVFYLAPRQNLPDFC